MVDETEAATPEVETEAGAPTESDEGEASRRRLSLLEKTVVAVCGVGVVAVTILALEYSGISIVGHTIDVLSESWTREATIGVIVALIVAVIVSLVIWLLARATVSNPADDEIEAAYTTDLAPH